jgi:hypothetical protein
MDNDPKIPDGWAMPDDLAKKVSETLNKNRVTPEDELSDALEGMARDIALIEPDPKDWGGWVMLLIDNLESEAKRRRKFEEFEKMLEILKTQIGERLSVFSNGAWRA